MESEENILSKHQRTDNGLSYFNIGLTMSTPTGVEFNQPGSIRLIDGRREIVRRQNGQFIAGVVQRNRLARRNYTR